MTLCNIDLYWLLSIFYVISCFDWHIGWKGAMEPAFCRIIWKELSFWPGAISRNSKSFVWKFTLGKWLGTCHNFIQNRHNRPNITPAAIECVTKGSIIVSTFNFSSKRQHYQAMNSINMFTYLGLSVSEILQSDYFPVYFQQRSHSISVRSVLISEFEEKQLLPSPRYEMYRFSQKA